jgi:uncharacterized membrane protein YedE/YeeE
MIPNVQTGSEPGLASLAAGIVHDIQELLQQQLRLFKHELEVKVQKTKEASAFLVLGMLLLLLGSVVLCVGFAQLLDWGFPVLAPWGGGYFIVAALALVPGAILAATGRQQLESLNPVPEETAEAIKENLQWTTNPR